MTNDQPIGNPAQGIRELMHVAHIENCKSGTCAKLAFHIKNPENIVNLRLAGRQAEHFQPVHRHVGFAGTRLERRRRIRTVLANVRATAQPSNVVAIRKPIALHAA